MNVSKSALFLCDAKKVDQLELELTRLATQWRWQHARGQLEEAENTVKEYHVVMANLWMMGWKGRGQLPDSELPDGLMPDYFIAYWEDQQ